MKVKKELVLAVSCMMLGAPSGAFAQAPAADDPAKVIRIYREEVKPGRAGAHERNESTWAQAFAKANTGAHYVALTSMTGPNEAWFIEPHDNFASIEKIDKAIEKNPALVAEIEGLSAKDGELLSSTRGIMARYREDLSYRPSPVNLGKAHYCGVWIERVKPGYGQDYEEATKLDVAAFTKAGITNMRWIAYQVAAGSPGGVYLYFAPMGSLAESDVDNEKAYAAAMGPRGQARQSELTRLAVLSAEFNLFAVNPKMSYLPKEVTALDPEFWTPKPAAPKAGAKTDKPKP